MNKGAVLKELRCKTLSVIRKFKALEQETIKYIEFNAEQLADESKIKAIHDKFPTESKMLALNYLYIVEFKEGTSSELIQHSRTEFKKKRAEKTINLSRHNTANSNTRYIYVGTSEGIKSRFRTHLGVGKGRTTWALYLREWLEKGNLLVTTIPLLNFTSDESQLIEDVLWDGCKPMFGKKGGK